MTKQDYELCKEACKEAGCFCPKSHIFHSEIANVPAWIRFYLERKGYIEALNNHNIIHGKATDKFLKDTGRREKYGPTKKEKKVLDKCKEIYDYPTINIDD